MDLINTACDSNGYESEVEEANNMLTVNLMKYNSNKYLIDLNIVGIYPGAVVVGAVGKISAFQPGTRSPVRSSALPRFEYLLFRLS